MQKSSFVYVTYIRTTPEKLWAALIQPEFTRQYFFGATLASAWKPGAPWKMTTTDGTVTDAGEVLEIDPPRRLVLKWRNECKPEAHAEGDSRMTYLIEPSGGSLKLTVTHEIDKPASKLIASVSNGWPAILASLKSLLETGHPLETERPCAH
ncbi:MAG TPA: SRPBCC family protein [Verrucomicrobiae bacterium]|nr:SRPBCC family protein [Verrucomicrobiae bacterium]